MMGYGARLAYGCNIGAYFSGVASASLYGWLCFVLAFLGSIVGIWLRPLFGLPVERARRRMLSAIGPALGPSARRPSDPPRGAGIVGHRRAAPPCQDPALRLVSNRFHPCSCSSVG